MGIEAEAAWLSLWLKFGPGWNWLYAVLYYINIQEAGVH
jgi:hypothetical protein